MKQTFQDFKLNTVIMNPSYNNGADIDFVFLANSIVTDYTVAITPAKWQTSEGNQRIASKNSYGDFRKQIVPHIKQVVFYPCCKDIFDILQVDGITYYIVDKQQTFYKCIVENKCKYIKEFDNSTEFRSILNRESLLNIGNEIVNYLGNYNTFKFENIATSKRFQVWTNIQCPGGNLSTVTSPRKTLFIGESTLDEDLGFEIEHSDASMMTFTSDSEAECKSFISWLNTKFTRFFTAINANKLTGILTNDSFRFVPVPFIDEDGTYKWDRIYNDKELYEHYGLNKNEAKTKEGIRYIDIIENIVKERK